MGNLYTQINKNKIRTNFLIIGFMVLSIIVLDAVGYLFNRGQVGIVNLTIWSLAITIVYTLYTYYRSTKITMSLNHAKKFNDKDLNDIVNEVAVSANIQMPEIYVVDTSEMNAFSTGRDPKHAAIAYTTGLLEKLNREEIKAVTAHEIGHIINYDIRLTTIVTSLGSFLIGISNIMMIFNPSIGFGSKRDDRNGGGFAILGLIASIIVILLTGLLVSIAELALSRNREYLADATGIKLTRDPDNMIRVLSALKETEENSVPYSNSASIQQVAYIADPGKATHASLFDTHPSLDDRIKRIKEMYQ